MAASCSRRSCPLIGSLAADAAIVAIGTAVFPATKGYVHFAFSDYAKLTIVGVIIASAGWPIVTRVSSAPRWVFFRSAILVTVVLFLPDLYLLARGDSKKAVLVLMVMHVAIAVVTYNALVRLAPIKQSSSRHGARRQALGQRALIAAGGIPATGTPSRRPRNHNRSSSYSSGTRRRARLGHSPVVGGTDIQRDHGA